MTKYLTTINLKNAAPADFEKLDREMQKRRFVPARKGAQEASFSEYRLRSGLGLPEVIAAVYQAVKNTGKDYSLTVIREKMLLPV